MQLEKKFLNILKIIRTENGSMSKKSSQKKILIKDFQSIYDFISSISPSCAKYMDEHKDYEYLLFSKYITHSDIISKGKRNE